MKDKLLGLVPPMGWNSWNTFNTAIDEKVVRESADAMVETGLRDAGYEYVVIDDCWSLKKRDEKGRLQADPEKFPSGMKALADYIHGKGLKFGMYSCNGTMTCARYPGSFDHEFTDAQTFADWGVDYLKYDNCFKPEINGYMLYNRMSMALRSTGRDILFSACNWGRDDVEQWIRSTGAHIYRSTGDIRDNWRWIKMIALSQLSKMPYSGSFCFNDLDMLVCGMYKKGNHAGIAGGEEPVCTDTEYATHFAFWCFAGSPLMLGCDIRDMNDATKQLVTNRELIEINQDIEGRSPRFLGINPETPPEFFWGVRMLSDGQIALAAFNFSDKDRTMTLPLFNVGLPSSTGKGLLARECVTRTDAGVFCDDITQKVEAHGCRVFRCKIIDAK